jgi:hypothetical protein
VGQLQTQCLFNIVEGEAPMSIRSESLFLRRAATVRRVDALFYAMSSDFLLRQQFVTNPTQVLSEYVHGTQVPSEQASVSNQLVYAVLSDRKLLTWLHAYAVERRGNVASGPEFLRDFAHAVAAHGGRHAVIALLRSSIEGTGLMGFDADVLHFFFNVGFVFDDDGTGTGTDGETGTDSETGGGTAIGTESGTDSLTGVATRTGTGTVTAETGTTPATDAGTFARTVTGTLTAVTWSTYITQQTTPGTNPGTDTGRNPFTGPGPVTRSPFTKTDHGTDNHFTEGEFNNFAPSHVMVTLNELTAYASRLREHGALELAFDAAT